MTLGYVLAAVICLDQACRSVKQLKKYNSTMFVSTLKYYLFVFSNCLNIVSVALIAYGIFKDHGLILPAIRIITGVLVIVGICAQIFGLFK